MEPAGSFLNHLKATPCKMPTNRHTKMVLFIATLPVWALKWQMYWCNNQHMRQKNQTNIYTHTHTHTCILCVYTLYSLVGMYKRLIFGQTLLRSNDNVCDTWMVRWDHNWATKDKRRSLWVWDDPKLINVMEMYHYLGPMIVRPNC